MSEKAVVVERISKMYPIGHRLDTRSRYTTLRDVMTREVRSFARGITDMVRGRQIVHGDVIEKFWALRDVSFEIQQGDVFGIIGRNGAGKSTLLKILSRITEPTTGRAKLRGRVASLLEVGTGFHPELTGRENIFLNGAILGMTQHEIKKKFDEIVAFADVEKFLDTPVKHFSSGMYVRLAFSVAAYLEQEILIVDEVLAVGDAEFQKKSIGKLDEVSRRQGRTVLFVSHNMEAVLKLCTKGVLLEAGTVKSMGDPRTLVPLYLQGQSSSPRFVDLATRPRESGLGGRARLLKASCLDESSSWSFPFGQPLTLDLSIARMDERSSINLIIGIFSMRGFEVATWTSKCDKLQLPVHFETTSFRIEFMDLRLLPGQYYLALGLVSERGYEDAVDKAVEFDVMPNSRAAEIDSQELGGAIVPSARVSLMDERGKIIELK